MYNHPHPHHTGNNNNNNNWNSNNTNNPFNGTQSTNNNNNQHMHNGHRPSSSSTAATTLTTSTSSSTSTMTTTFTLEQQQQKQIEALRRQLAIKDETILDLNASIITIEAETQAKLQQSAAAAARGGNEQQQQQQIQQENELLQQQLQQQLQKEAENQAETNRLQQELRRIRQEANISNSRLAQLQKKLLLQQHQAAIISAANSSSSSSSSSAISNAATKNNGVSSSSSLLSQQISPSPTIRAAPPPQHQQQQRVVQSTTTCPNAQKQPTTPTALGKETANGPHFATTTTTFASSTAATLNLHPTSSGGGSSSGLGLAQHLLQSVAPAMTRTIMKMMMNRNGFTSTSSSSSSSSNIGSSFQSRQHEPDESSTTTTMATATTTALAQQDRILLYLGKVVAAAAAATVSAALTEMTSGKNYNNTSERSMLLFLLQECSLSLPLLLLPTTTTASTPPMGQDEEQAAAASAESISTNRKEGNDDMEIDVQENQAPAAATATLPVSTTTTTTRPSTVAIAMTVSRDYISYTWLYHYILAASYNNGASRTVLNWLLDQSSQQEQEQQVPPMNPVPMEDDSTPHASNVGHVEQHHMSTIIISRKKKAQKRKMTIRIPLITAVSDTARDTTNISTASNGEHVASDLAQLEQQERLKERLALRAKRLVGQRGKVKENNVKLAITTFYPDSEKSAIEAFMQSCRNYALLLPLVLLGNIDNNNSCRRVIQNKNKNSRPSTSIYTATAMVAETSIRALQIVSLLHSQQRDFQNQGVWIQTFFLLPISSTGCSSRPVAGTAENDGEGQEEQNERQSQQKQNSNDATYLLDLWCHASHIILDRGVDKNDSDGRTVTKRRLLRRQEQQHHQQVVPASSTGGNNNATNQKKKQSVNGDAPNSTTRAVKQQQQQYSMSTSSLVNRMSILSNEMLHNWMAASLHVLRIFWMTTLNSSITLTIPVASTNTTDCRNLGSSQSRQQQQLHHEFWLDSGHPMARNLLAAILDWMQVILLPTPAFHEHPLTMEAIAWLQCLIDQPPMIPQSQDSYDLATSTTTTSSSRNLQNHHQPCSLLLLRTQMSTTASAPRVWHRADTAIGVAVKFFHILVLRQHQDDHLSNKDSKEQNDRLNPIRDALVRFFDSLLRVTQHERRRQEAVSWNKNGDAGSTTKKTKLPASFVSFWTLLSEYQELYTSAASLLLTTTSATASTETENCTTGCHVDADIMAMLRMQMDELAFDEEEREEGLSPP